jgi:hypothetical protein
VSRKHYVWLANWIGVNRIGNRPLDELMDWLAADNPNFDRIRFFDAVLKAAGPTVGPRSALQRELDQERIKEARYEEGLG